eukprot:scaffold13703_cov126-Skeletonema_dohrnii-CCMP3373.AAC.3
MAGSSYFALHYYTTTNDEKKDDGVAADSWWKGQKKGQTREKRDPFHFAIATYILCTNKCSYE